MEITKLQPAIVNKQNPITKLKPQEPLDCLSYKPFEYQDNQWDNLPLIIPKFQFHLESNIQGISQKVKELTLLETVSHLREYCEESFESTDGKI